MTTPRVPSYVALGRLREVTWLQWFLDDNRVQQRVFAPLVNLSEKELSQALNERDTLSEQTWRRIHRVAGLIARFPGDESMWTWRHDDEDEHEEDGTTLMPRVSIDAHLTILFNTDQGDQLVKKMREYADDRVDGWNRKYRATTRTEDDGYTMQASPKFSNARFARLEMYRPKEVKPGFEFTRHVRALMRELVLPFADVETIGVSRADAAFDFGLPLWSFHFISRFARECDLHYRSGLLTGIDIGSRKSPTMIRIYDKRAEQRLVHKVRHFPAGPCTRYEVESKTRHLTLVKLHKMPNPLLHQPFFKIENVELEPPYREYIELARNLGLGAVTASLPPAVKAELVKRLEQTDQVASYLCPRLTYDLLWRKVAKRFLRDIGVRP